LSWHACRATDACPGPLSRKKGRLDGLSLPAVEGGPEPCGEGDDGTIMNDYNLEKFIKILPLENEVEARLMDSILSERNIPHLIRSYQDVAYDGLFQLQKGWGHVEAPEQFKKQIEAIYEEISDKGASEEPPPA
jgi:hypothetical protein